VELDLQKLLDRGCSGSEYHSRASRIRRVLSDLPPGNDLGTPAQVRAFLKKVRRLEVEPTRVPGRWMTLRGLGCSSGQIETGRLRFLPLLAATRPPRTPRGRRCVAEGSATRPATCLQHVGIPRARGAPRSSSRSRPACPSASWSPTSSGS
jgi:hypothetical protein